MFVQVSIRPHFKSNKSSALMREVLAAHAALGTRVSGVCAQKLSEAEVLAACGVDNVLITNQIVGPSKVCVCVRVCASTPSPPPWWSLLNTCSAVSESLWAQIGRLVNLVACCAARIGVVVDNMDNVRSIAGAMADSASARHPDRTLRVLVEVCPPLGFPGLFARLFVLLLHSFTLQQ